MSNPSILAIVPARAGSQGLRDKNVLPFAGRPLVEHTLRAAQACSRIGQIVVSSNDTRVLAVAAGLGIDCTYQRPAEISGAMSTREEVVRDVLRCLPHKPEYVLYLQPTSPLRSAQHIDAALDLMLQQSAESLVSVHRVNEHPLECLRANGEPLLGDYQALGARQLYDEEFFFDNGAIYLFRTDYFLRTLYFYRPSEALLFKMPRQCGIDINDELDFKLAELIFSSELRALVAES